MVTETAEYINEIASTIKSSYKPDLIVLFGSYARGDINEDSDIDLLIVKNTSKKPIWRRVEVRKILDINMPVDIIVYTPREFEMLKTNNSLFLKEVLAEGKIIYEKQ